MKRVRVLVVFEDVDENFEVVQGTKFGSITNVEDYAHPEWIAAKAGDLVTETIRTRLPDFLEAK